MELGTDLNIMQLSLFSPRGGWGGGEAAVYPKGIRKL